MALDNGISQLVDLFGSVVNHTILTNPVNKRVDGQGLMGTTTILLRTNSPMVC
jgi:hypothetical protein